MKTEMEGDKYWMAAHSSAGRTKCRCRRKSQPLLLPQGVEDVCNLIKESTKTRQLLQRRRSDEAPLSVTAPRLTSNVRTARSVCEADWRVCWWPRSYRLHVKCVTAELKVTCWRGIGGGKSSTHRGSEFVHSINKTDAQEDRSEHQVPPKGGSHFFNSDKRSDSK